MLRPAVRNVLQTLRPHVAVQPQPYDPNLASDNDGELELLRPALVTRPGRGVLLVFAGLLRNEEQPVVVIWRGQIDGPVRAHNRGWLPRRQILRTHSQPIPGDRDCVGTTAPGEVDAWAQEQRDSLGRGRRDGRDQGVFILR